MSEHNRTGVDRETIKIFWQAATEEPKYFWLALLFPLGAVLMGTVVPLFIGKIIASLADPTANHMHYMPHLVIFALLGVIANRVGITNYNLLLAKGMHKLHKQAFETLLRRSVGFHNNTVGGKLVSDVTDFVQAFMQLGSSVFSTLVPFLAVLIVGSALVFSESIWLGLVILLTASFAFSTGFYDSRKRIPLRRRRLKAGKAVTAHVADSILNLQTIKTFAREDAELRAHKKLGNTLREIREHDWVGAGLLGNQRIATLLLLQIAFVLLLVHLVQRDPHLLGIGIFAFTFTVTIFNRLFDTFTVVRQIDEAFLQASPMTEIILGEPEILDKPGAKALKISEGRIELRDLAFAYEDAANGKQVFSKLSLDIKPGEKVGLVGPSGGGKSTLTRLLLRFDDIQDGEILIDDQNIAYITQASLRQNISYVPQEPLLFHRTIKENISYGKPLASDSAIQKVAKMAHADDFIDDLPQKYDTIVGERGVKLSGGQRQRIAIARTILKNAPILILDEATSALDSENEILIQEALWQLMENRTAVVVAHRLSTIQRMDRIIVLDQGQIVEQGSHKDLLKQKGLYAKLWKHQSGGFLEE